MALSSLAPTRWFARVQLELTAGRVGSFRRDQRDDPKPRDECAARDNSQRWGRCVRWNGRRRGIQVSGEDGIVRFKTVYPGWYNGRAIHIHFLALRPGSAAGTMSYRSDQYMVFTTQMYFAESFSRMIHEQNDPYKTRANGRAYDTYVRPQNMTVNPTMQMQGTIAVGTLNIITAAGDARR